MRRIAVVLGTGMFTAGCGGGQDDAPDTTPATTTGSDVTHLTATETEFAIKPDKRKVPLGDIVFTGVNKGKLTHILEVEGPGSENETSDIPPGGSADLTLKLRTKGTYELYCPIDDHKQKGMVTTIVVG